MPTCPNCREGRSAGNRNRPKPGGPPGYWARHVCKRLDEREIGVSLTAQTKLEELQGKLNAKAKAEPTYRFYALYDKIYRWDVLVEALKRARANKGAAGVDGQTFKDVEEYGEERWLQELQQELQKQTYRPQAVRRVMIPKAGGGERPLGIPTIRDRVVQTAAKLILEPIFEADFSDAAYGYRPGRSAVEAVRRVVEGLRKGATEVVDADLSKYFDTIPHAELMTSVAKRIADKAVLHLIKMWLKVPVEERDEQGRPKYSGGQKNKQGTPQGGVISPLLANVYINRMLKAFAKSDLMQKCGAKIVVNTRRTPSRHKRADERKRSRATCVLNWNRPAWAFTSPFLSRSRSGQKGSQSNARDVRLVSNGTAQHGWSIHEIRGDPTALRAVGQ